LAGPATTSSSKKKKASFSPFFFRPINNNCLSVQHAIMMHHRGVPGERQWLVIPPPTFLRPFP
jgi:hypothetical protein